jgi:hypothetical protein
MKVVEFSTAQARSFISEELHSLSDAQLEEIIYLIDAFKYEQPMFSYYVSDVEPKEYK